MPARIRLQRFGIRHKPFYKIVVADSKANRDGKFIEKLGWYNPIAKRDGLKEFFVEIDRTKYWLTVGAQPSDTVAWLLSRINLMPPPPLKEFGVSAIPKQLRREGVTRLEDMAKALEAKKANLNK